MLFSTLLFCVALVSATLVCDDGEIYVKFLKENKYNSQQEVFKILSGTTVLFTSPDNVDYEMRTSEACLAASTNSQYTLELTDTGGTSWTSGSYLEIQGIYGNTLFKQAMVEKEVEIHPLSFYTPVEENATWKFASGSVADTWKAVDFDASQWTNVNLASPSVTPSGTQYFRLAFTGMSGLAAYELSLKYTAGMIAYINGNEIIRDNMPTGVITSTTPATGSYATLEYHSIIRSALEVATTNSVLAVELHSTENDPATSVVFNAWMMIYASTTTDVTSLPCYAYPYTPSITATVGTNPDYAMDMNKGSYWGLNPFADTPAITYTLPSAALINAVSVFPEAYPAYAPRGLVVEQSAVLMGDDAFTTLLSESDQVYQTSTAKVFSTPFVTEMSRRVRLTVNDVSGVQMRVYEFRPLICALEIPASFTLTPNTVTANVDVDEVIITPTIPGFFGCSITPALPAGLELLTNSCTIRGYASAAAPTTTYTVTSTAGVGYSATFSLTVNTCMGSIVEVTRTYKTNADRESFRIVEVATNTVVFEELAESTQSTSVDVTRRFCLTGTVYRLVMDCSTEYWTSESYVYIKTILDEDVKETILRARYDDRMGSASVIDFNIQYAILPQQSWYYHMGDVPAGWYNGPASTAGWTQASRGSFPASSNGIQLYKKTFTLASLADVSSFTFAIRHMYGAVVYVNGHKVYQHGFEGELTASSTALSAYTELLYRQVTVPAKSLATATTPSVAYLQQGENVIAIGLVAIASTQTTANFDAYLRVIVSNESARVFDYTVTYSGITGKGENAFTGYSGSSIYKNGCNPNHVEISFNQDRRETLTSITVYTYYSNMKYLPDGVVIKAKNMEDDDYVTLSVQTGWKWWQNPQAKKLFLEYSIPYNTYRFEDFTTGNPEDCYWKINNLNLLLDNINQEVPPLAYPATEAFLDIELAEVFPNAHFYRDFEATTLPAGLVVDRPTGVIAGTPIEGPMEGLYNISAIRMDGVPVFTLLNLSIHNCHGGRNLITLNLRSDTSPTQISYVLYAGRGTTGEVLETRTDFPSNTLVYADWCLPHGLYSIAASDSSNGWYFPAGFYLTVDKGTLTIDLANMPANELTVTKTFSSYLPMQMEFDTWRYWNGLEEVPAEWTSVAMDDSQWEEGLAMNAWNTNATTIYLRRSFAIPSLDEYHVLNLHAKYNGGLIAYFNGRRVACFNMPGEEEGVHTITAETPALNVHDVTVYSKFHVILVTSGAVGGMDQSNVLAVEAHRAEGQSTAEPLVIDVTGVFGVEDCSPLVDSYQISGTAASSGSLEDLFDGSPETFATLSKSSGGEIAWMVENQEGSKWNHYGMYLGTAVTSFSWTLEARHLAMDDFTVIDRQVGLAVTDRERTMFALPLGIAAFRSFKFTLIDNVSANFRVSELLFTYCKAASEGVCPGIDDYPPVSEGEVSPAGCPAMYTGYSFRECHEGMLGAVNMTYCVPKAPADLKYERTAYTLVKGVVAQIPAPTYINLIEEFFLDEHVQLPAGLQLDLLTGAITGIPEEEVKDAIVFTIYGKNARGAVSAEIGIAVRVGQCAAEGDYPTVPVDTEYVVECSVRGSYLGTKTRKCVLGEVDGEWQAEQGSCIAVGVLVTVIVVVVVVVVGVVVIFARVSKKRKNVAKKPTVPAKPIEL